MLLDPYVAWLKVKSARLWFVVISFSISFGLQKVIFNFLQIQNTYEIHV